MSRLGMPSLSLGSLIPDPMAGMGMNLGGMRERAPRLDPQQEQSMLADLAGMGLGGINYVAQSVTKPQAALFGALAGDWGQLAQLIPFSDTMGLTDPTTRYDFRDVLDTWGVSPQNVEGFHPIDNPMDALWDTVGLAGDLVIDPLLPLSGFSKALTGAGKVGKAAGLLDELRLAKPLLGPTQARMTATLGDLAKSAASPGANDTLEALERAAVGMGYKADDLAGFMDQPVGALFTYAGIPIGTADNPLAMKAAGAMDWLREKALFNPVMRPVSSLLDAQVMQSQSSAGQDLLMPTIFRDKEKATAKARGATARFVSELEMAGGPLAEPTEDASDALRQIFEGVQAAPAEYQNLNDFQAESLDSLLRRSRKYGGKVHQLVDEEAGYFPRYFTETIPAKKSGEAPQIVSSFDPSSLKRLDEIVNVKGGTVAVKKLAQDPAVESLIQQATSNKDAIDLVRQHIEANYPDFTGVFQPRRGLRPGETQLPDMDRAQAVAEFLVNKSPEARESGIFGNHVAADFGARQHSGENAIAIQQRLVAALGNPDFLKAAAKRDPGGPGRTLKEVFRSADMKPARAAREIARQQGRPLTKDSIKSILSQKVPDILANDIAKHWERFTQPKAAQELSSVFDSLTNLYRAGVTSPWPAFHSRNAASGAFNNWLQGAFGGYGKAEQLMQGKDIDATKIPIVADELAARGLPANAENSSRILREILYAQNVAPRGAGIAGSGVSDSIGSTLESITSQRVGENETGILKALKEAGQKYVGYHEDSTWVPWKAEIRGVRGAEESTFGPMAAGDVMGNYVESLNRVAPMIELLGRGVEPAEAAKRVAAAQVNYSNRNFTELEQGITRYLMPFYKFSRQQVPQVAEQILTEPGGKLAKTLEVLNAVRGDLSAAPDYVRESSGISLGEAEDGTNRYITGLGLPFEDALSFLGGGPQQAGLELLSRSNPAVKLPLEWATGQSFFQRDPSGGRPLEDLDPTIGRALSNMLGLDQPVQILGNRNASQAAEATLANSPITRLLSTGRTLTDPRKGILAKATNLATGVRLSDISPAAEDAVIRERIEQRLKELGAKDFTRIYFPNSDQQLLDPQQRQIVEMLEAAQNTLVDRAKERKEAKAKAAPPVLPGAGSL